MTGSAGGAGSCVRVKKRRRPEEGSRGGDWVGVVGVAELSAKMLEVTLNKETLFHESSSLSVKIKRGWNLQDREFD